MKFPAACLGLALIAACTSSEVVDPGISVEDVDLRAAKGRSVVPFLNVQFHDNVDVGSPGSPEWSLAGIRGDGRLKTGAVSSGSPSNEYESKYCGVEAWGGSSGLTAPGWLNIDPDMRWTDSMQGACGGRRLFHFYLAGLAEAPTPLGPHTLSDIGVLSVGEVVTREVRFGVQMTNCAGIRFSDVYPPSVNARVTRLANVTLADGTIVKQWLVESQGSHRGSCVVAGKKDFVGTGVSYYLPFAMTVTEIPGSDTQFP